MAGLMQLLLDTVDAGIDDANYQKIQNLKVNEILLNQTTSIIDKEKNSQNQDLVDAISNERHANAAKVNKALGREVLIDFDTNAFLQKVNGQIIGKIKEFGNFSSEVVADLYTKSILELTMQIANGGIDTIERIANNSNQGVSEIIATSFNVAKNTPSFYKYENNTEILNGIKSDVLVTGVLIAGYASLTQEEKDKLWENALGLPPEQTIQLYEAEIENNPYKDYPGKTEEEKIYTKINEMQFRIAGLMRLYIKSKGNLLNKDNFDIGDFESFVRSQPSIDPNLIDEIFSKDYINFADQEFERIYESSSTPNDDKDRFQKNEILQIIGHLVESDDLKLNEDGEVVFLNSELESRFHSQINEWNKTLSSEKIYDYKDLYTHNSNFIRNNSGRTDRQRITEIVEIDDEGRAYSEKYKEIYKKNISSLKQETKSTSQDEFIIGLSDFEEFLKVTDEDILLELSQSTSNLFLQEIKEMVDEDFYEQHPNLIPFIKKIGFSKAQEILSEPDKRKELLDELSSSSRFDEISPTITETEAKPVLNAREENMIVASIPTKNISQQEERANLTNNIKFPPAEEFEDLPEDNNSAASADTSSANSNNTGLIESGNKSAATVGGFWSNFMRHMREDKGSKGLIGRIRSAYRKAREDRDKELGFAKDEPTEVSNSESPVEEPTFDDRYRVDMSGKSTPIAPQPEKTTTDTKSRDPEEPTQGPDDPTL